MESFKNMFGNQSHQARKSTNKSIMSLRMNRETPVRDHMLTIIILFNVDEVLGASNGSRTQNNLVLETLQQMFSQFIVNYNLHKMDTSLTELMKELQSDLKTKSRKALVSFSGGNFYSKSKRKEGKRERSLLRKDNNHRRRPGQGKTQRKVPSLWSKGALEYELLGLPSFQESKVTAYGSTLKLACS